MKERYYGQDDSKFKIENKQLMDLHYTFNYQQGQLQDMEEVMASISAILDSGSQLFHKYLRFSVEGVTIPKPTHAQIIRYITSNYPRLEVLFLSGGKAF